MAKKKRFVFLSNEFYKKYPEADYPEIEQKHNRPYIQVCVEISGIRYAIPLRSDIHHPYVLWTDKANRCGVDFSKTVVIKDESYIDAITEPHLRQNEFDALRGKDYKIKIKLEKYIEKYKEARLDLSKPSQYHQPCWWFEIALPGHFAFPPKGGLTNLSTCYWWPLKSGILLLLFRFSVKSIS